MALICESFVRSLADSCFIRMYMKITLCGSIAFIDEMADVKHQLEVLGHEVKMPPLEVPGPDGTPMPVKEYYALRKSSTDHEAWVWDRKADAMSLHFDKVAWADVILVTNYDKRDVEGYIGPNTLMEMGLAFYLKKKIYLLNPVPYVAWREEILGMRPIVIASDFALLR